MLKDYPEHATSQARQTGTRGFGARPRVHGDELGVRTRDDAESTATLLAALDAGVNFFDTAEVYGPFQNEGLLGRAFHDGANR